MNSDCRHHAGLLRRLGAMLYDGFLLAGVLIVAAIPLPFFQSAADASAWVRALIQIYLVLVCFIFFWLVLDARWTDTWHAGLATSTVWHRRSKPGMVNCSCPLLERTVVLAGTGTWVFMGCHRPTKSSLA